jgi:hypothetical protein
MRHTAARLAAVVVLWSGVATAAYALPLVVASPAQQTPAPSPSADDLYAKKDYSAAAAAYEQVTSREPNNGRAWYRLGASRFALKQYRTAVEAYLKAAEIGQNPFAMYNLACAYARLSETDRAIEWLGKAADAGFAQSATIGSDEDLAALRSDPRFASIAERVVANERPCAVAAEWRQFDFWAGDWDVLDTSGQRVGTSHVERILRDCVVFENWTDYYGGTGKSFNYRDASTGKWHQTWVDDKGLVTQYVGGFSDGAMRLEGESVDRTGAKVLRRMTISNLGPDKVRQVCETTRDGGKSWSVDCDLTYVRTKQSGG